MAKEIQINNNLVNGQQQLLEKNNLANKDLATKLDHLTKEMNEFTYIVSHDLQAPLRMVTGFLELLEKRHRDQLNDSAKQYIDYAVKGANKMKSLVFDLLVYSRLNNVSNEHEEVDLNVVMQDVKVKFQTLIDETGALITTSSLPVIKANKTQMEQLFYHLLGNALKYQSIAKPEIEITSKQKNGIWVFSIKDNGIGIDPAFFEKIFVVFRRLHSDETKYGGTGIGLAICKKIVELHGGTIWVESILGKGSTFSLTLTS